MIIDLVDLTVVVPLLFGLFWGAPLLAKELEDGTHNLAWTQSVPRWRWLRSTASWALLAAALWGGALAVLVSWWRYPENALDSRFSAFDIQGIVPVAYAVFAVAVGIAVGSIVRRVLPALALTIAVFLAVRIPIAVYLRPHFMTPLQSVSSLGGGGGQLPAGAWVISQSMAGPGGATLGNIFSIPVQCQPTGLAGKGLVAKCLLQHGFHATMTYQPASRYWAFQGIEAGIFLVLAALLIGFAFFWVLRRDA